MVAVLGLTAAFVWGTVGIITALAQVDGYDRTAVHADLAAARADRDRT